MATYNGERFIRQQIESILNQSYSDFELIIGDDCSSDATLDIINEYSKNDNRIVVVSNSRNLGFKKNFEKLLNLAKGDYVALSDQDDVWTEDHLEKLLAKSEEYDLVCSNAYLVDSSGQQMGTTMKDVLRIKQFDSNQEAIQIHLMHYNFVQGATCLISRNLLEKSLPIPEEVKFHDYWLALCAAFSRGIYYYEEPLLLYRQHGLNVTENKKWSLIRQIFSRRKHDEKWLSQLSLLTVFNDVFLSGKESCSAVVQNALEWFSRMMSKSRIKNLKYFFKNYRYMYFDRGFIVFFMRFFQLFVLGV